MSEYLTYTLWQQREQRMPDELEHQRQVQERLNEQQRQLDQEQVVSTGLEGAEAPELADVLSGDEYALVDE